MLIGGIPFLVGAIGLLLSAFFFAWEVRRGSRLWAAAREKCDRLVTHTYRALVFGEVPHTYRIKALKALRTFTHRVVVFLVSLLRGIERPLARLSHRMRTSSVKETHRAPSPFLKTIQPKQRDEEKKEETPLS